MASVFTLLGYILSLIKIRLHRRSALKVGTSEREKIKKKEKKKRKEKRNVTCDSEPVALRKWASPGKVFLAILFIFVLNYEL